MLEFTSAHIAKESVFDKEMEMAKKISEGVWIAY